MVLQLTPESDVSFKCSQVGNIAVETNQLTKAPGQRYKGQQNATQQSTFFKYKKDYLF